MVDDHLSNGPRRYGEKVLAILCLETRLVEELQVGLVHQCRGVENGITTMTRQLEMGDAAQIVVDERHQPTKRKVVTFSVCDQEIRDVVVGHVLVPRRRRAPTLRSRHRWELELGVDLRS